MNRRSLQRNPAKTSPLQRVFALSRGIHPPVRFLWYNLAAPVRNDGAYLARDRQTISQIHTPPDRPVRAADMTTRLPDGLNGAEAKREGGIFPMAIVSMKALLESGVHFGHRTN